MLKVNDLAARERHDDLLSALGEGEGA